MHWHLAYKRIAHYSPQRVNIIKCICLLFIKCDEATAACSLCSNWFVYVRSGKGFSIPSQETRTP